MTVTKINGFRAPYRSATFQKQADALSQTNGLIKMTGVVYESGSDVMVPPCTFIQNGLIVSSDTQKIVAKPSMEAPYYLTVSAPTSNPVDDLSYQFAKAPTDISSNEVVVAAYDGLEWRMFPFISLKGVYNQLKQDRVDFGSVGPINGLYTTENGSDYETSGGTLIDPTGEVKVLTESRLFPQVGDDPDWSRVDRIVYRRALDAEKRIGERTFCLGGTYSTSPTSLYVTLTHDNSLVREKVKSVIGSDNTAHMFVASGYGDNWQIVYSKQSSDRQVELVAPMAIAVTSSKHFDVLIDNNDEIHLLYIFEGDVYWKKLDDVGADVAGPIQIDTQPNDCTYLALATDPHYSKLYAVWSSLISTDENNLFFKTLNLNGNTITEAKQLTTGSTNHIRPQLHVTEDLWVYLVYEVAVTASIWYTVLDDIGEEIEAPVSVSGATNRIGVGTLVDQASHPKVAVSDNKSVYITFLQDKGGAAYGVSVWNDGEAFMQELVDPSESFEHYGFYLDSTFNGLHFILSRAGNINYTKLEGEEVSFTIQLAGAGSSGVHTVMDKFGSMFHSWTAPSPGTFTDYDTGLAFTHTGPQVVVGALSSITLQNTDMLLLATAPSQEPKKGERVVVSGSAGGLNDGTYYIDAVELVTLDAADDYYQITMTTAFPVLETGAPVMNLGAPNGNEAYFEKSTSETSDRAFRKTALESDVLLARIVRPGPGILNYYNVAPAVGPDFIIPHGTEVSIDWSLTAVDNLTITSDLNLYDMLNATNYLVANGSYPMNEGEALYVVLDPTLPSITPQVAPLNSLPFSDNMRVLGAVINGYFNPFLLSIGGMGVLDPNEQVVLGEDVPQELRSKIGFVSETEIELYPYTKGTDQLDTYPQFMGETNLIAGQNTHIKLIKGQVSWVKPNADELVFLSEAFLQIPELAESRNRIAPQTVTLDADGKVAWVNINRLAGAAADLTVNVSAIEAVALDGSLNRDVFIIARRTGDDLIINGSRLLPGSSKDLDSDLTIENKTLIGSGVDESTSAPDYSGRGAPERNLDDSQGILEALTSLDIELDKFFDQLRITAHETDADKVRVSGVDLVMKDGSILSQEISSLLMKFEGAVIDFTTGDVFESDGVTSLGLSFTPTTLADTEVCWYSLAIVSAGTDANNTMGAQFLVLPGAAAVDEASAVFPPFGGQKKIGMVLVQNSGGSVGHIKIRQLGVGSGSGGGGLPNAKLLGGGNLSVDVIPGALTEISPTFSSNYGSLFAVNNALGQTFIATQESIAYIDSTSFAWNISPNFTLRGYLMTTTGYHQPDAIIDTSTNLVSGSELDVWTAPGPSSPIRFNFNSVPLIVGNLYAFVVVMETRSSGEAKVSSSYPSVYPDGLALDSIDFSGPWGTNANYDLNMSYVAPDVTSLAWDEDLYVSRPGLTNGRNTIPAGSVAIEDGQAAYVLINQLAGIDDNLTVQVDNIEDIFQYDPNLFIFARGVSDGVVIGNSFKLIDGESKELDAGLSIENRALLGNGVTEATSDPDYSGRGAPLRTIADSEKMLEAMASMDTEIDKFFGQLRLVNHDTDAAKAVVTGVDLVMKEGAVLSQEISNLVMSFEGAVINFETGAVLKSDGATPLGNNFTPTTLADTEYAWYSVSLISDVVDSNNRMTVKFSITPGAAAADEASAVLPGFAGQTKIGQVLVHNDGGAIGAVKFRQLGASGGGSSGGGGAGTGGKLLGGGDWKHSSDPAPNTLSWSADAYVSLPGLTNGRNTILAGSAAIGDGQAAYAILSPLPGPDATVPVTVDNIENISPYTPNLYVFAWNKAGVIHVGSGGNALTLGKTKKLDVSGNADKQDKNLKLIEGGEWSFSEGPEGVVEDTSSGVAAGSQGFSSTTTWTAVSFTPSDSVLLSKVQAKLSLSAGVSDATLTAYLYNDVGGDPGSLLATSTNGIHTSAISETIQFFTWDFDSTYLLDNTTKYWIVWRVSGTDLNPWIKLHNHNGVVGDEIGKVSYDGGFTWNTFGNKTTVIISGMPPEVLNWSADAYVQIEGLTNTRNRIVAGYQAIADGEVIYVNVNREPGSDDDLTVNVSPIESIPDNNLDALILARRVGNALYLGTGTQLLRLGERTLLDRANLITTRACLIGGGDWSVAEVPDVLSSIASSNDGLTDIAVIDSESISVSNTFIPDIDLCKVGELSISLSKANAPVCDMVVDIVEVIGGIPSTTVLGTSQPVAASSLLDSIPTDVVFTFANTNLLSDSVTYGFVLRTINVVTLDASNYIVAHGRSGQGWRSGSLVLDYYSSITWSPSLGLFCAVTESYSNGSVSLSSDGVNWSRYLHGIPSNWRDVTWSPSLGLFCAVGSYDNHIMTSPDGINWTVRTPPSTGQWYCVDWSETLGIFSALKSGGGVNGVMVSSDGVNWTGGTVDSVAFQYIRWIPDLGLFIATTSDTNARIYRSSDGLNWTYTSVADYGLRGVAWSPELSILVLVSERNAVYISSDGVAWTQHVITENWRRIDWSVEEQLFYVAGRSSASTDYAVSADGINWTLNPGMIASDSLSDVIYESGSETLVLLGRRNQTFAYKPELYTDGHFFLNSGGWTAEEDKDIYFTMDLLHENFFSLSWSEDIYISLPGLTNSRNTIPAGFIELLDGLVAYANLNTLPGVAANLTPEVTTIDLAPSLEEGAYVFARREGDVCFFEGNRLVLDQTKKLHAAGNADKQDKNLKLIGGGEWSFVAGELSWSAAAFIQADGLSHGRNNIPSGSIALSDGEVAYVNINRLAGADDNLTVSASTMADLATANLDAFVIARRVGDNVYLGAGGNRMGPGEVIQLDKPAGGDPSFKVKGTAFPSLGISGGFLRTDDGFVFVTGSGTTRDTVGVNIDINLDTIFGGTPTNDTTYYLYVDRDKLGDAVVLTDSGESVYTIEEAQYTISAMEPSKVSPFRFIHVQTLRYGTGAWVGAWDAPRFLPDSVGGFFDTIQVFGTIINTATVAQYPHSLDGRPGLFTLEYFDGTKLYPLDHASHIIDVTDAYLEIDTSTLTFGGGEWLKIAAYRYPSTQFAAISNEFTSPWFVDTSTTQFPHKMVDAQDIRDYEVQEWDVTAGKIRNIDKSAIVVDFDDTNIYLDWTGVSPSATLKYRVVGGRSSPVTSVPVRYGGYNAFVGMGPGSYSTLQEAITYATPGASILVAKSHSISSPIDINKNDIKIEFMPGVIIKVIGGTADGIIISGSRVDLLGLNLEGDQNAVMTNLLRISGDDCQVERARVHINDSNLTVNNAVNLEGSRNYITSSVRVSVGALTNTVTDSGTDNEYSVRG